MRKTCIIFVVVLFSFVLVYPASGLDTSSPLLCSVIKATECTLEKGCTDGTAGNFDLPQFLRLNFAESMINEVGENSRGRTSKIKNIVSTQSSVIIQGVENERGWSIVVGADGRMTATVTGSALGFVVFGACITP